MLFAVCPDAVPARESHPDVLLALARSSALRSPRVLPQRPYPIRPAIQFSRFLRGCFASHLFTATSEAQNRTVFSNFLTGFVADLTLIASLPINWELFSLNDEKNIAPLFWQRPEAHGKLRF
jgi:hypothetical protein